MTASKMVTSISKSNQDIGFIENKKLIDYCQIDFTSLKELKESNAGGTSNPQEVQNKMKGSDDKIIDSLLSQSSSDSMYNFKKDFLVLFFDQTEEANSIEYKRKVLSQKLMADVTFSLNKALEFTFQDQIKNNIISTLSKNTREQNYSDYTDARDNDDTKVNNNYILNLCCENFPIDEVFGEEKEEIERGERKETLNGGKVNCDEVDIDDELVHTKRDYTQRDVLSVAFNYIEDEEFDQETYQVFLNFIEEHKNHKLSSKIRLVLAYINEVNPRTGNPIFTNKMKNEKLRYWKEEYLKACAHYKKQNLEFKKKNEAKMRKSSQVKESKKILGFK